MLVSGCGERILGSGFVSSSKAEVGLEVEVELVRGRAADPCRGPVRIFEGRICSKPWDDATASMDLKYCLCG